VHPGAGARGRAHGCRRASANSDVDAQMKNAEVAAMLTRIADLLEIKGENFFKIRAYREAVRQVDNLTTDVEELRRQGKLQDLPGIGGAIEQKIGEFVTSGELDFLTRLEAEVPPALLELTRVPGLGPRTAKDIYDPLGIMSLDALEQAAVTHRLQKVRGIKAKTEENILGGIAMLKRREGRIFFPQAWLLAESFLTTLRALPGVRRAEVAGSLRRARETVRDLDLLVASDDPDGVTRQFATLPQVQDVIAQGDTKSSIRVRSGMQVDLRAVKPESFGAAWQYFTGSQAHNVQLRGRSEKMGRLKINEYGVFREDGTRLGGMTDHSQSLQIAEGLTPERFAQRSEEIARVNAQMPDFRVLSGAEVDILPDGSLDLPDDCLAALDVVVASVHTALDQPTEVMTQ